MPRPSIALLDGNNFYCACERVFNPKLLGQPLVVLSNNDGCAIARSEEAKALGIRMGAPWFQIEHLERSAGLIAHSANFELYGDMSRRMMGVAEPMGCGQEVYSIDECFIDMTGIPHATERARHTRAQVLQQVGIPTCIGIGPTKTLAKLANHIAKSADRKPGSYPVQLAQVCNLQDMTAKQLSWLFKRTAVGEVWGVGPRIAKQLQQLGVSTVEDLRMLDPHLIKQRWSVMLERTVRELNGTPCFGLDDHPAPKQNIACTRSFGQAVTELADLREAVSTFASRAAHKARQQGSVAESVLVFVRTSPFRANDAQYSRSYVLPLRLPASDSLSITGAALQALEHLYKPGYRYAKAGVMLLDLSGHTTHQAELDLGDDATLQAQKQDRLMRAMDEVNARFGKGALKVASVGIHHASEPQANWHMRQTRRSPRYTTQWNELLEIGHHEVKSPMRPHLATTAAQ